MHKVEFFYSGCEDKRKEAGELGSGRKNGYYLCAVIEILQTRSHQLLRAQEHLLMFPL